jgi:hypothetical protein
VSHPDDLAPCSDFSVTRSTRRWPGA